MRILTSIVFALSLSLAAQAQQAETWRDAEQLEQQFAKAIPAVEKANGATFKVKPKLVITTAEKMVDILKKEMSGIFKKFGMTTEEQINSMAFVMAHGLAGKYEPATHTVHLLVENVAAMSETLKRPEVRDAKVMQVLIIHELAHALDFERYPNLEKERQGRPTPDGIQAVGAVLEGHAQFITAKIAKEWELEAAFETMVSLIVAVPPTKDPSQALRIRVMAADIRFAYVKGHQFFDAVFGARGKEGVEKVLADPPKGTKEIGRPSLYLDPSSVMKYEPGPAFAAIRDGLKALKMQNQEVQLKRTQVRAAIGLLPKEQVDPIIEAFRDGKALVHAKAPMTQVICGVYRFGDEKSAQLYVKSMRALNLLKDKKFTTGAVIIKEASYTDYAGTDAAKLLGFQFTKKVEAGPTKQLVRGHFTHHVDYAIEILFINSGMKLAAEQALVAKCVAAMKK